LRFRLAGPLVFAYYALVSVLIFSVSSEASLAQELIIRDSKSELRYDIQTGSNADFRNDGTLSLIMKGAKIPTILKPSTGSVEFQANGDVVVFSAEELELFLDGPAKGRKLSKLARSRAGSIRDIEIITIDKGRVKIKLQGLPESAAQQQAIVNIDEAAVLMQNWIEIGGGDQPKLVDEDFIRLKRRLETGVELAYGTDQAESIAQDLKSILRFLPSEVGSKINPASADILTALRAMIARSRERPLFSIESNPGGAKFDFRHRVSRRLIQTRYSDDLIANAALGNYEIEISLPQYKTSNLIVSLWDTDVKAINCELEVIESALLSRCRIEEYIP